MGNMYHRLLIHGTFIHRLRCTLCKPYGGLEEEPVMADKHIKWLGVSAESPGRLALSADTVPWLC